MKVSKLRVSKSRVSEIFFSLAEIKSFSIWSPEFESSECVVSKRRGESLRVLGFRVSKFRVSEFLEFVRVSKFRVSKFWSFKV